MALPRDMHIAEQVIRDLVALERELVFCPSTPDKCNGCEIDHEAVLIVRAALERSREAS